MSLAVCVGVLLGSWLPPFALIDQVNMISFILLGILVVMARQLSTRVFNLLIIILGLSHGYANGLAELSGKDFALYIAGVLCAAYLFITLSTAAGHWLVQKQQWGTIAVRALGSWITAISIMYFGYTLVQPAA